MQILVNNLLPHDVTSYLCVNEQNTKYLKLHKAKFLLQKTQYVLLCKILHGKIFYHDDEFYWLHFWLVYLHPVIDATTAADIKPSALIGIYFLCVAGHRALRTHKRTVRTG